MWDEWEHDNEPDMQALRDEEQVSALYDQYVERQYNEWCEQQLREYEAHIDLLAFVDVIEDGHEL